MRRWRPAGRHVAGPALALILLAHPSIAPALDTLTQFEGLADSDNNGAIVLPPDDNLAAGPSHLFEMVNNQGRITDKSGGAVQSFGLRSFFAVDAGFGSSDPEVIYDAASGRWFATYGQSSAFFLSSSVILAVSTTSDPTGTFCRYRLGNPTSETFQQDQPTLGVSDDKIVVSYNAFTQPGGLFAGGGYYVVNKNDLVACGGSIGVVRVAPNFSRFALRPAQSLSSTSTLYLVGNDNTSLALFSVDGVPGVSPVTATSLTLPIRLWSAPPQAQQAGSSVLLDTGDERVLSVAWQNGSLWLAGNESCVPTGDTDVRSCLRFIEVRTDTGSVRQDMTFGAAGSYYYYPALRPDSNGNVLAVFTESSSSEFASVRVTGRLAGDAVNTFQPSHLLRAGTGAQTDPSGRMGDYSGAAVDPTAPFTVWVSAEYIRSTQGANWGTYIAQVAFPNISLGLALNLHTAAPGDLIQVSITAANSGGAGAVDIYFVLFVPPATSSLLGCPGGDALVLFANGFSKALEPCVSTFPIQSFEPLYSDASLPARMPPVTVPDFYSLVWPAGIPGGTYTFAIFTTPAMALADGIVNVNGFAADSLQASP